MKVRRELGAEGERLAVLGSAVVEVQRLEVLEVRNAYLVAEIEQQLTKKLADRGIAADVNGRRKRAYSIWRKMERKSVGFEQLSDIVGFRVIVRTLAECYQALGIVHTTWPVVPGRSGPSKMRPHKAFPQPCA